jgi:hypothetical protein
VRLLRVRERTCAHDRCARAREERRRRGVREGLRRLRLYDGSLARWRHPRTSDVGVARRARIRPRRASGPPLRLRVGDERAGARLTIGEVVAAVFWARVSVHRGVAAASRCDMRTSWPRAVSPRRPKAEAAERRGVGGVPYAVAPWRRMRRVCRALGVAVGEGDAAAVAHGASETARGSGQVHARGMA